MKDIFKSAGRQVIATAIIMAIGFVGMNYGSFYKIIKYRIDTWRGVENNTFEQIVELEGNVEQTLIESGDNLVSRVRKVPEINLEIMPPDIRLVVPKIDQNLPVMRVSSENLITKDWGALEQDIQEKLKDGVIHYPGTSLPDKGGNTVITGHSSYFPWDPGRFKDVFALLSEVYEGDKVAMYYDQKKYIYQVTERKIIYPGDLDILKQPKDPDANRLTLITCWPVGTNTKRLVIIGDLVETE